MATLNERAANVSLYHFEPAELSADTFQVVRFSGTEGVSRVFRFELQLLSTDPDIDFGRMVNKAATFTMMRGDTPTPIHGIVTEAAQDGRTADYVAYRAVLQPRLWRLGLSHQSRIFQEMTVQEILETVFKENDLLARDYRFALKGSYAPREYCVQFQESDLNFVQRLMEFEGMYYFFEQEDGQEVLVITDSRSEHAPIAEPATVGFHDSTGTMGDVHTETVDRFICEEQLVTGKVELKDYNYRTPETMTVESALNGQMPGTRYEYGEHFQDAKRGKHLAQVRNEELEAQRQIMKGESDSVGLRAGRLFTLEGHFRSALNGDYFLTHVEHKGSQRAGLDLDAAPDEEAVERTYQNRFTCIPAAVQYRPPRITPKPEVPGVTTARVESAGGDYAYIDDQGRYHVQMHYDQRTDRSDGTKTLPVRLKQAYSGPDYGIHFPNHADTEMLIAYENGDIDRPIALGTTPNPSQKAPSVAKNKMQNVVRTHAGNQLIMDDTIDKTIVRLNSADANLVELDDEKDRIHLETTKKHTATFDDKNEHVTVKTTSGHTIILDDKNKKVTVQSKKGHFLTIDDEKDVITVADEKSNNRFSIDAKNKKLTIESKEGDIDMLAPDGVINIKAKELKTESSGDTTMKANNLTSEAQSDHTMEASNITAKAKMDYTQQGNNVTSKASMAHKTEGMQVSSKGSAKNDLQGAMVSVKASGINQIQGSMVKIN